MIRLEKKYEEAVHFRKRGFTYSEIAKVVGVSKSTVSNWLSKKAFSKRVRTENTHHAARDNAKRIALMNKTRAIQQKAHYAEAVHAAETEFKHYQKDPLFVAGLMLYVSSGDTTHTHQIRVTSSHAETHRIFLRFAKEYLGVADEKLHFWILLYPYHEEKVCVKFWKKFLSLKEDQFYKTQIVSSRGKKRVLHKGVGNTIIGSTVLKVKLSRWIELALAAL